MSSFRRDPSPPTRPEPPQTEPREQKKALSQPDSQTTSVKEIFQLQEILQQTLRLRRGLRLFLTTLLLVRTKQKPVEALIPAKDQRQFSAHAGGLGPLVRKVVHKRHDIVRGARALVLGDFLVALEPAGD